MKIKNWLFLALTLCLTASATIAQTSKGTVGGVVTDQSGAVVVGATVILTVPKPTYRAPPRRTMKDITGSTQLTSELTT